MSRDGRFAFLTFQTSHQVGVFNRRPGAVLGQFKAGKTPRQFALEPGGRTLLVTNTESGQVEAVDLNRLP